MIKNKVVSLLVATALLWGTQASALTFNGGSVSFGFDSEYIFRGADFGKEAPWTDLYTEWSVSESTIFYAEAWYINPSNNVDELDIITSFVTTFDAVTVEFGHVYFYFAEADATAGEFYVDVSTAIGEAFAVGVLLAYDWEAEGLYAELYGAYAFDITENIAGDIAAGVSYGDDYYGVSSLNHAYVSFGINYQFTETFGMYSYVMATSALGDLDDAGQGNELLGGVSVTAGF